jgi:hypothetical protein
MATTHDPDTDDSQVDKNSILVVNPNANREDESDQLGTNHPNVVFESFSEILIEAANTGNIHPEKFAEGIANSHRYLQQQFYNNIIKPTIKKLAENNSDRRNENAVSECKQIVNEIYD